MNDDNIRDITKKIRNKKHLEAVPQTRHLYCIENETLYGKCECPYCTFAADEGKMLFDIMMRDMSAKTRNEHMNFTTFDLGNVLEFFALEFVKYKQNLAKAKNEKTEEDPEGK